ncbi:MAG: HigA family addiction module antitoxin [Acidobacteria bacterium]|nr:HigA family addiction module antitoxin [Acidobacteriota bacterium]
MRTKSKSRITTKKGVPPAWSIHPGEILREEFLKPLDLSVYALARKLRVPAPRINDIVLEKRGITADTALRLARFFGTSDLFWMNLQSSYEVRRAKAQLGKDLRRIEPRKTTSVA